MKKYENFCVALTNLRAVFDYEKPYNNVVLTGMVALYEICFEQAWKMMKAILEIHGYEGASTGSPRWIIKTAYQASMIADETLWLAALQARNNVSHSYNRAVAYDIIRQTKEDFYDMFGELKKNIEESWL